MKVFLTEKTGFNVQDYPFEVEPLTAESIRKLSAYYCGVQHPLYNAMMWESPVERLENKFAQGTCPMYADSFKKGTISADRTHFIKPIHENGVYSRIIFIAHSSTHGGTAAWNITENNIPTNAYLITNITAPNKLIYMGNVSNITSTNNIGYTYASVSHTCDRSVTKYTDAPNALTIDGVNSYQIVPYFVTFYGDEFLLSSAIKGCTPEIYGGSYGGDVRHNQMGTIHQYSFDGNEIRFSMSPRGGTFSAVIPNLVINADNSFNTPTAGYISDAPTTLKSENKIVISAIQGTQNVGRIQYSTSFTDIPKNHCNLKTMWGIHFIHDGEVLKPIIRGGIVVGYSNDLTEKSDLDNWDDFNHSVPSTPVTPPTPTGGDDIDDMVLGYDILDNGMIKYYQITVGDLDKVSTVIENMSYAKTIKSVWDTLNDTSEPNKLDTILNTLRTWGVSADNLLPSIVSLKSFGISTSKFLAAGGTKSESIVLNGVDCETNTTRILASSMAYHIGDYTIGGTYGDAENPHFLDYAPYTHMEIYIPFCGTVEIPSKCMYNKVNVYLIGDIFSGSCVGVVKCKGAIVATKSGMIGVDTPLTSNGNGMKSNALMSGIMNSVGIGAQTILSGATGNMGGIMSGATAGMSNTSHQIQAGNENYTRMIGNVSDKCAWALPHQATIKIVHPIPNYGENYDRTYGKPVCKSRKLTAGDGFTIVDNPIINGNMTLAEKIEIENYLKSGVIL